MPSRSLNDSDIANVLANLTNLRDRTLFIVGLRTGFRISELLSITVADCLQFGAVKDSITVKRGMMKGKRQSRTVPLHPQAKQAIDYLLKNHPEKGLYHPQSRLFDITRQHAWRVLKGAANAAQLSGCVSTHSMRKTFGMNVYNRTNKNIVAAQKALGHASLASTSHYLSVGEEEVNAAILA